MTLEDKVTTYLHNEWVAGAGNEAKREAVGVAQGCIGNYWETIKYNPDVGSVDDLIKADLVDYVDDVAERQKFV